MHRTQRLKKKRAGAKAAKLASSAPQVTARRTVPVLAAGPDTDAADRTGFSNTGTAKTHALWESMLAMSAQIVRMNLEYAGRAVTQSWRAWTGPSRIAVYRPTSPTATPQPRRAQLVPLADRREGDGEVSRIFDAGRAPGHKRASKNARSVQRRKR